MYSWPEKTRPGFVVFHQDYRADGYGVGMPEDESYFPKPKIEEFIRGVLVHPENFLGIIDQFDETLQFFVNDDRSVLIEFILREREGAMSKVGTVEECVELVRAAGPSLAELKIPDASFKSW